MHRAPPEFRALPEGGEVDQCEALGFQNIQGFHSAYEVSAFQRDQ